MQPFARFFLGRARNRLQDATHAYGLKGRDMQKHGWNNRRRGGSKPTKWWFIAGVVALAINISALDVGLARLNRVSATVAAWTAMGVVRVIEEPQGFLRCARDLLSEVLGNHR
jgi:multidrug transporter EmrE-like cation transporter